MEPKKKPLDSIVTNLTEEEENVLKEFKESKQEELMMPRTAILEKDYNNILKESEQNLTDKEYDVLAEFEKDKEERVTEGSSHLLQEEKRQDLEQAILPTFTTLPIFTNNKTKISMKEGGFARRYNKTNSVQKASFASNVTEKIKNKTEIREERKEERKEEKIKKGVEYFKKKITTGKVEVNDCDINPSDLSDSDIIDIIKEGCKSYPNHPNHPSFMKTAFITEVLRGRTNKYYLIDKIEDDNLELKDKKIVKQVLKAEELKEKLKEEIKELKPLISLKKPEPKEIEEIKSSITKIIDFYNLINKDKPTNSSEIKNNIIDIINNACTHVSNRLDKKYTTDDYTIAKRNFIIGILKYYRDRSKLNLDYQDYLDIVDKIDEKHLKLDDKNTIRNDLTTQRLEKEIKKLKPLISLEKPQQKGIEEIKSSIKKMTNISKDLDKAVFLNVFFDSDGVYSRYLYDINLYYTDKQEFLKIVDLLLEERKYDYLSNLLRDVEQTLECLKSIILQESVIEITDIKKEGDNFNKYVNDHIKALYIEGSNKISKDNIDLLFALNNKFEVIKRSYGNKSLLKNIVNNNKSLLLDQQVVSVIEDNVDFKIILDTIKETQLSEPLKEVDNNIVELFIDKLKAQTQGSLVKHSDDNKKIILKILSLSPETYKRIISETIQETQLHASFTDIDDNNIQNTLVKIFINKLKAQPKGSLVQFSDYDKKVILKILSVSPETCEQINHIKQIKERIKIEKHNKPFEDKVDEINKEIMTARKELASVAHDISNSEKSLRDQINQCSSNIQDLEKEIESTKKKISKLNEEILKLNLVEEQQLRGTDLEKSLKDLTNKLNHLKRLKDFDITDKQDLESELKSKLNKNNLIEKHNNLKATIMQLKQDLEKEKNQIKPTFKLANQRDINCAKIQLDDDCGRVESLISAKEDLFKAFPSLQDFDMDHLMGNVSNINDLVEL